MTTHLMFDGRLQIYRRGSGKTWQCAARVGERRFRSTTKEEDLARARDVAEGWYLELRGKLRNGEIVKKEHTFGESWDRYLSEMRVLTIGERSPSYINMMVMRMEKHALPYFREKPLSEVNRGLVQAYRARRAEETIKLRGKPPARNTMMQEIVHIRQVLKWAEGMGWIPFVPNLTPPYKTQGKKGHRAWFSKEEYVQLYKATAKRIEDCPRVGCTVVASVE